MGPPVSDQMSTSELGRRNYSNYRSSQYSMKTSTEKMVEEVARLFLDQIHLEKEVEKIFWPAEKKLKKFELKC